MLGLREYVSLIDSFYIPESPTSAAYLLAIMEKATANGHDLDAEKVGSNASGVVKSPNAPARGKEFFNPVPSNDPANRLNWPMTLKVCFPKETVTL